MRNCTPIKGAPHHTHHVGLLVVISQPRPLALLSSVPRPLPHPQLLEPMAGPMGLSATRYKLSSIITRSVLHPRSHTFSFPPQPSSRRCVVFSTTTYHHHHLPPPPLTTTTTYHHQGVGPPAKYPFLYLCLGVPFFFFFFLLFLSSYFSVSLWSRRTGSPTMTAGRRMALWRSAGRNGIRSCS